MIYLVILVLAASLSIGRLWMLQHRQKSHLQTVDGFRAGWQALSEPANPVPAAPRRSAGAGTEVSRRKATPRAAHRRPEKLDPARRAAAKKRIAARRAARHF